MVRKKIFLPAFLPSFLPCFWFPRLGRGTWGTLRHDNKTDGSFICYIQNFLITYNLAQILYLMPYVNYPLN